MKTPTPEEMTADVLAAVASGARGVGYWPVDMDTEQDIYETDPGRWQAVFAAIAQGGRANPAINQERGLYVVKPRYSQYWEQDDANSLRTLAALRRAGLCPAFLLVEQVLTQPLPPEACLYYLPDTYKYEDPEVLKKLLASGTPIFFGWGAAEPRTPEKTPLEPLYTKLGLQKMSPAAMPARPAPRKIKAFWQGRTYNLVLTLPNPLPRWVESEPLAKATFTRRVGESLEEVPLVFTNGRLIFLAAPEYEFLMSAAGDNDNEEFLKALFNNPLKANNLLEKG